LSELSPEYLRGIELFNTGQFFDCHEVLEDIWRVATGEEREILHALIQAAVALHHLERGNLRGANSVLSRSIRRLGALPELVMGVETRIFARELSEYVSDSTATERPPPRIRLLN
jgi:uncharacterized protein